HFRQTPTTIAGEWGTVGGATPWIAIEPIGLRSDGAGSFLHRLSAGKPFDAAVTRDRVAPRAVGPLACLSIHASPQQQQFPVIFVTRAPSAGADQWISDAERELQRSEN